MTRKSDGYTTPEWFNPKLREASFELDDALWETHSECSSYAPIARAIEALEDADIALERAASAMSGSAQDRETGLGPKGASAVAKRDAQ